MTEETPTTDPTFDAASPGRARIDPPPPKRLDALPVLYVVGLLILASAVLYLWRHPSVPRSAALQAVHVDTMRQQIETLSSQVAALQARPAMDPKPLESRIAALESRGAPVPAAVPNLGPIEGRLAALEARPPVDLKPLESAVAAMQARAPVNLAPLEGKVAALEAKPAVDLRPLEGKVAALEAKPPVDLGPLTQRQDALAKKEGDDIAGLGQRLDQVEAQGKQTASGLAAVTQRAALAGRLQAMSAALAAGQRLGEVPGAPPALARFAHDAPPTEAGLRLSFDRAAVAAHAASQPALTDNQPFFGRMWTRAQQAVTVRQGDTVLVGDPIAGVIEHARQSLDAGDLAGAVATLNGRDGYGGLTGPAKAAMAGWLGEAQSLLDARAAIGALAGQSDTLAGQSGSGAR